MTPLPQNMKEELQKEYVATFDRKMAELEEAFAMKSRIRLRDLFHKLAGSGRTYEMDEISNIAKVCENILNREFPEEKIRKALDHLRQAFAARKEDPSYDNIKAHTG